MGVHTIQAFASTSGMSEQEIQDAINDWVSKNSEWIGDTTEHQITTKNTASDGSGSEYRVGMFRFELDDAKDNLMQKATDKLKNKVAWFSLVYHQCDHDESDRGDCTWDERWNWEDTNVTIPSDVESIIPEPPTTVEA